MIRVQVIQLIYTYVQENLTNTSNWENRNFRWTCSQCVPLSSFFVAENILRKYSFQMWPYNFPMHFV